MSRLAKEAAKQPEKLEARRRRVEADQEKRSAIEEAATTMLETNKPIVRAKQVQAAVQDQTGMEVPLLMVRQVMRKDMHMGYRLAKTVAVQCNHERCLVLRQ